jgi:hypothetical protein
VIRGLFKAPAEQEAMQELHSSRAFRVYLAKIATVRDKARQDLMGCAVRDLADRRAYLRALEEILTESSPK